MVRIPDATDIWQPVDCNFGRMVKAKITQLEELWIQQEENIDLWMGNAEQPLNAGPRRILITQWVGEAYNENMFSEQYAETR